MENRSDSFKTETCLVVRLNIYSIVLLRGHVKTARYNIKTVCTSTALESSSIENAMPSHSIYRTTPKSVEQLAIPKRCQKYEWESRCMAVLLDSLLHGSHFRTSTWSTGTCVHFIHGGSKVSRYFSSYIPSGNKISTAIRHFRGQPFTYTRLVFWNTTPNDHRQTETKIKYWVKFCWCLYARSHTAAANQFE